MSDENSPVYCCRAVLMKGSLIVDYTEKMKTALIMKIHRTYLYFQRYIKYIYSIRSVITNIQRISFEYLIEFDNVL